MHYMWLPVFLRLSVSNLKQLPTVMIKSKLTITQIYILETTLDFPFFGLETTDSRQEVLVCIYS